MVWLRQIDKLTETQRLLVALAYTRILESNASHCVVLLLVVQEVTL